MKFIASLAFMLLSCSLFAQPIQYVKVESNQGIHWGILEGQTVFELDDSPWNQPEETGTRYSLSAVTLHPPVTPTKVLAVGLNYRSHSGNAGASQPELFAKFPSSIQGDGPLFVPADAESVHYEGELVIVIGRRARKVSIDEARDYIFGITVGNDVSERGWQSSDLQWVRAKASDGFAPIGSILVEGLDWSDLMITTRVNGVVKQNESTANLLHSPEKIVSWISQYITLEPGDVIFTGTPGRTSGIEHGDIVEVSIEGVGAVRNRFLWESQ